MAKNIIILNGSPRVRGNTSALTAEFKRGAEEADSIDHGGGRCRL